MNTFIKYRFISIPFVIFIIAVAITEYLNQGIGNIILFSLASSVAGLFVLSIVNAILKRGFNKVVKYVEVKIRKGNHYPFLGYFKTLLTNTDKQGLLIDRFYIFNFKVEHWECNTVINKIEDLEYNIQYFNQKNKLLGVFFDNIHLDSCRICYSFADEQGNVEYPKIHLYKYVYEDGVKLKDEYLGYVYNYSKFRIKVYRLESQVNFLITTEGNPRTVNLHANHEFDIEDDKSCYIAGVYFGGILPIRVTDSIFYLNNIK